MSQDHTEIVQRLKIAQQRTREAYEHTFKGHDAHAGTEVASAWPFITAAYSGIEQAFKFLIAQSLGLSVEELVTDREAPADAPALHELWPVVRGARRKKRSRYRHHNLGKLFRRLDPRLRAILSEQYRQFRTLHTYIPLATVGAFLTEVSAERGQGYELWRYSLTSPEKTIPTNSAEALLAIWDVAAQLCDNGLDGSRVRGTHAHLAEGFAWGLEQVMEDLNVERVEAGHDYHDFAQESTKWVREHGGLLSAFAKLAHRAHRQMPLVPDADGHSPPFLECLKRWILAGDGGAVKARSDVRVFVARAQGHRGPAQSVRWDGEHKSFEDVQWELPEVTSDDAPPTGYRFEGDRQDSRWQMEKRRVLERGFSVRERHLAKEAMPSGKWLCTLSGEKVTEGDRLTIRFWEHPELAGVLCVEIAGAEDTREGRLLRDVMRIGSDNSGEQVELVSD